MSLTATVTLQQHCTAKPKDYCGSSKWTKVAYLDMSNPSQQCPSGFMLRDDSGVRSCGRQTSPEGSCSSVKFPFSGSEICGVVIGYQDKQVRATEDQIIIDINEPYLDGVSITYGSPRKHIWSFLAGKKEDGAGKYSCPCNVDSTATVQSFVGNDYFCESARPTTDTPLMLFVDDPLWDGAGCGGTEGPCCETPGIPVFHQTLGQSVDDELEIRICAKGSTSDRDSPIKKYDIYSK